MAEIVGRIGPAVEFTESEAFDAPTRIINVVDSSGRLHGKVQWLLSETGEGFSRGLLQLYVEATSAPSIDASVPGSAGSGA